MPTLTTLSFAIIVLMPMLSTVAALWWLSQRSELAVTDLADSVVLVLRDGRLSDATERGRQLLSAAPEGAEDLTRLAALLAPQFPSLPGVAALRELAAPQTLHSGDGGTALTLTPIEGALRVELIDTEGGAQDLKVDLLSHTAMLGELDLLRHAGEHLPVPSWREEPDGSISWVNHAYLDLIRAARGPEDTECWPLPRLFEPTENNARQPLAMRGQDAPHWFTLNRTPLEQGRSLCTAIDSDAMVRAEERLAAFTQTLTQTFATLTIGLAVFDAQRRLATFNPAFGEMTGLGFDILAARPSLTSVLTEMREARRTPEPRDWRDWRERLAQMESGAQQGDYFETWTLPGGETWRVSGRPHPDGAIAFVFENISLEIAQTRELRGLLSVNQSIIDRVSDAMIAFDAQGQVLLFNSAYSTLWPEAQPLDGATDSLAIWEAGCSPAPFWRELKSHLQQLNERDVLEGRLRSRDGRALALRAEPISGGAWMIVFSRPEAKGHDAALRLLADGSPISAVPPSKLPGDTGARSRNLDAV